MRRHLRRLSGDGSACTHANNAHTHAPCKHDNPPPHQIRDQELRLIRASCTVKTANLCLVFAVPPTIALVIYATYAYAVGPLTPAMAFVVLSLFNTLRFPLVVLPKALRGVSGALGGRLYRHLARCLYMGGGAPYAKLSASA